jgi:hypothetical protein
MLIQYPTSLAPESLKVLIDFARGGGDPKAVAHVVYHDTGYFLGSFYADEAQLRVGASALASYSFAHESNANLADKLETELGRLGGSQVNEAGETVRVGAGPKDLIPTAHLDPAVRAMIFELIKRAIPLVLKFLV